MAAADELVELMFSWIEKREDCAEHRKKLADELETLRKKCNAAGCVGSTVSVIGAASMIVAGLATFFTAGAAAPFVALAGVVGGAGVTVSVGTKITEHFSSSATLKDAEKIEKESNEIAEEIQNLFEQLKAEVKRTYPSADPDQVDRHVMTSFMAAVARRSGLELNFDFSQHDSFDPSAMAARLTALYGIFTVFSLKTAGKQSTFFIDKATEQLIKEMTTIGLETAINGGAMDVGAVGMGYALPEAIGDWKRMIENNHETEASRSLRDTAEAMLKNCSTLRKEFDNMRTDLEEMDRRQMEEEERARRQMEEEEKARRLREEEERARRRRLGFLVVGLFICLVVSYYRGNIMTSDPVQEKSVNLMNQTDQTHVIEHCDQSEQPGREEKKDSQQAEQTGGDQGDDEDKERDQCEINQTPPGTIRIGSLNTRSMNQRTSRISELITGNNLLTTETWLRDEEGFRFHYQVRDGRRGGGVANQFSEELQGEELHFNDLNITTFEFVVTELQHDDWDQPVVIINLYLPPPPRQRKQHFLLFLKEFQRLLNEVKKKYSSIIVTGDFNIPPKKGKTSYTDKFDELLQDNNLRQHVNEPTRGNNILDLVITSNVEISDLFVRDDRVADHSTVYFNAKPKDTGKKNEENENEEHKRFKKSEE